MDKAGIRVLVLDDEDFIQKLLAHMLRDIGFSNVTTSDNGSTVLQWLDDTDHSPDLILLDLNMPKMDGIEFVRKLVDLKYSGSLILISVEDERVLKMAEKLVLAHDLTLLGHLRKPVALADLVRLTDQWRPPDLPQLPRKTYPPEELRAAIQNGELINYYQPKIGVATGVVIGVESLVRWNHPTDGLVFPDQFIGVAEQHGLIDDLTRTVIINALAQAKAWQDAGLWLKVAINVSMDNLTSVTFADFVAEQAAAAGVAPQDIVLELTESRFMLDQRAPLEILTRLRIKRFRLSIDDFGTGHSSLTHLRDISFDELKIDRSFVHGAWRDKTALALYHVSLNLGEQFGMEVVAEGVEDHDDWTLIQQTGCDLAQGYFIARPMKADKLPGWIELWQRRLQELRPQQTTRI